MNSQRCGHCRRLRRATEAARAELLATDDARQTVVLTLVSDVANDYFTFYSFCTNLASNFTTVPLVQASHVTHLVKKTIFLDRLSERLDET
jgi:hypothetical protein